MRPRVSRWLESSVSVLLLTFVIGSQVHSQQPERERSTSSNSISFGVTGAANMAAFRTKGAASYEQAVDWAAGAWMNVPLVRFLSLESHLQYSRVASKQATGDVAAPFLNDVSVNSISLPLLLKLHLRWIALTAGGQLDIPISIADDPNVYTLDDVASVSVGVTGGLDLFPRSRVSLYGRYMFGFTNVDGRPVPDSTNTLYNQVAQIGLRVRLFGGQRSAVRAAAPAPAMIASPAVAPPVIPPAVVSQAAVKPVGVDPCAATTGAARPASCPVLDSDGDGLTDRIDKCPLVAGSARFDGCPPLDTDSDGVLDDVDACASVPGLAKYNGCPPPDQDRDGIIDEEDRCPTVMGARETMGCPRLTSFMAEAVTFAYGRATLTPSGRAELDKVVAYMQMYTDVRIRLSGHTDNSSSDATNNPLSEQRANAAMEYLRSREIDASRMTAEGHGSAQPTTGNGTAAGRAKNRRVEVIIR